MGNQPYVEFGGDSRDILRVKISALGSHFQRQMRKSSRNPGYIESDLELVLDIIFGMRLSPYKVYDNSPVISPPALSGHGKSGRNRSWPVLNVFILSLSL